MGEGKGEGGRERRAEKRRREGRREIERGERERGVERRGGERREREEEEGRGGVNGQSRAHITRIESSVRNIKLTSSDLSLVRRAPRSAGSISAHT